jgi:hypothetical protein
VNRTYSTQAIRAAVARAREDREIRRQDAEALAAYKEGREMTHKQTKYGPVPKPPDLSALDDLLDDLQGFIDEALEVAEKAAARERALSQSTTSSDRFQSLGGTS